MEIEIKTPSIEIEPASEPLEIELGGSVVQAVQDDYNKLKNIPSINDVKLINDKTFEELGALSLTNMEIEELINKIVL